MIVRPTTNAATDTPTEHSTTDYSSLCKNSDLNRKKKNLLNCELQNAYNNLGSVKRLHAHKSH